MSIDDEILEELRQIRKLLEPKSPPPSSPQPKGLWAEFIEFISKYKVMGLAVAFILGQSGASACQRFDNAHHLACHTKCGMRSHTHWTLPGRALHRISCNVPDRGLRNLYACEGY
ncbi:MAG: hypothetical protein ACUVTL_06670 [Thermoproteota archaeon]